MPAVVGETSLELGEPPPSLLLGAFAEAVPSGVAVGEDAIVEAYVVAAVPRDLGGAGLGDSPVPIGSTGDVVVTVVVVEETVELPSNPLSSGEDVSEVL